MQIMKTKPMLRIAQVVTMLCTVSLVTRCFAQQPGSPLEESFQTYRKMKDETKYRLDWISLGPTLNSARADVVQLDPMHPGTMYVGFGSGGLWKTIDHGVTWNSIFEEQAALGIGDM